VDERTIDLHEYMSARMTVGRSPALRRNAATGPHLYLKITSSARVFTANNFYFTVIKASKQMIPERSKILPVPSTCGASVSYRFLERGEGGGFCAFAGRIPSPLSV